MNPFHDGEKDAQQRAGYDVPSAPIRDHMPEQHRIFFAEQPFLVLSALAEDGYPVAGFAYGNPGFISSPDPATLHIGARLGRDEPLGAALHPGAPVGVLGIDQAARRRNRMNGMVTEFSDTGLWIQVLQSFGNCPKYIANAPPLRDHGRKVRALEGMDDAARRLITDAETFFVASSTGPETLPNGGMDISHRGGPAGFVRLDGNRLIVPDFMGNRYFNTFGNFLKYPRASALFPDFYHGRHLLLAGEVEIDWTPLPPDGLRSWSLTGKKMWRWE